MKKLRITSTSILIIISIIFTIISFNFLQNEFKDKLKTYNSNYETYLSEMVKYNEEKAKTNQQIKLAEDEKKRLYVDRVGDLTDEEILENNFYVQDNAHVLSDAQKIYIYEQNKNLFESLQDQPELAVVTLEKLPDGADIDLYKTIVFNTLGVGKKGVNNGILLLIAISDSKYAIAVGDGYTTLITESQQEEFFSSEVISDFRSENYGNGISKVVTNISDFMADSIYGVNMTQAKTISIPKPIEPRKPSQVLTYLLFFLITAVIWFIFYILKSAIDSLIYKKAKRNFINYLSNNGCESVRAMRSLDSIERPIEFFYSNENITPFSKLYGKAFVNLEFIDDEVMLKILNCKIEQSDSFINDHFIHNEFEKAKDFFLNMSKEYANQCFNYLSDNKRISDFNQFVENEFIESFSNSFYSETENNADLYLLQQKCLSDDNLQLMLNKALKLIDSKLKNMAKKIYEQSDLPRELFSDYFDPNSLEINMNIDSQISDSIVKLQYTLENFINNLHSQLINYSNVQLSEEKISEETNQYIQHYDLIRIISSFNIFEPSSNDVKVAYKKITKNLYEEAIRKASSEHDSFSHECRSNYDGFSDYLSSNVTMQQFLLYNYLLNDSNRVNKTATNYQSHLNTEHAKYESSHQSSSSSSSYDSSGGSGFGGGGFGGGFSGGGGGFSGGW